MSTHLVFTIPVASLAAARVVLATLRVAVELADLTADAADTHGDEVALAGIINIFASVPLVS